MWDLTIVYYTANVISDKFAMNTGFQLLRSAGGIPIESVSSKPIELGNNQVFEGKRGHLNIYRQALVGAKAAKTKYIALAEDDVLYAPEHFEYRPSPGKFAYNMNAWNIFTWGDPLFSQKLGGRKNLNGLICERDLFVEAIEERFAKYPDDSKVDTSKWAEPGKYEGQLGVTARETEGFFTNPSNVIFSHETALSFEGLGKRKRVGEIRATEIPYWGNAKEIRELYV